MSETFDSVYELTIELLEKRKEFIAEDMPYATATLEAYDHVLDDLKGAGDYEGLFAEDVE